MTTANMILGISDEVLDRFPDVRVEMLVAWDLCNDGVWADTEAALVELESAAARCPCYPGEDDPEIASWHAAYRSFGSNPRRARPSVEALLRRLARHGRLPRVSGAVDAYDAASVRFRVPAGGFDLDQIPGRVEIRFATAHDRFTPLGEPDLVETPTVGEVIYAHGARVLTRHWNHRDAHATRVQPSTRAAVFLLEGICPAVSAERLSTARSWLAGLLGPHVAALDHATLSRKAPVALIDVTPDADPPGDTGLR